MKMLPEYFWRIIFVATAILAQAQTSVGNDTDKPSCAATCNLKQGFCLPNGECKCFPGWEGPNCDQCSLAPGCIEGTCNEPWECICKEGYAGRHCHLDMRFCERHSPCQNGATCINKKGSYMCACATGFNGKDCQVRESSNLINTLMPMSSTVSPIVLQCLNGGTCVSKNELGGCEGCSCQYGYTGEQCETLVRMCATRPCANGGRCHNLVGDFRCECPSGYQGRSCNEDKDECAILGQDACANGGRCINKRGSYRCVCSDNYQGARCQRFVRRIPPTSSITVTPSTTVITTTAATTTEPIRPKKSPLETYLREPDSLLPVIKKAPILTKLPPSGKKQSSTSIKVTHIVRQVEVESSNAEGSFVEKVMDSGLVDQSSNQASVSVVQAVTFAFLGVAVALFISIGIFVWIHCRRRRQRANTKCWRSEEDLVGNKSSVDASQRNSRSSIVISSNEKRISQKYGKAGKNTAPPPYRPNPGPSARAVTSSHRARESRLSHPVDCLYVALPPVGITREVATTQETSSLLDVSRLQPSSNYSQSR